MEWTATILQEGAQPLEELLEIKLTYLEAVNFTPPSKYMQNEFDVTFDVSAYKEHGPIELSYPPFQWEGISMSANVNKNPQSLLTKPQKFSGTHLVTLT